MSHELDGLIAMVGFNEKALAGAVEGFGDEDSGSPAEVPGVLPILNCSSQSSGSSLTFSLRSHSRR